MSKIDATELFFFWILLDERLDETFFSASVYLAERGVKLMPIHVQQVSRLAALSESGHVVVMCSTRNAGQYATFSKSVAPILGLLLRQERLSFFHLSSYQKLDLGAPAYRNKNYFFLKYPLSLESLCDKLKRFHELRLNRARVWPGGRRAKVPGLAS